MVPCEYIIIVKSLPLSKFISGVLPSYFSEIGVKLFVLGEPNNIKPEKFLFPA